ncbi:MAG: hypothetical protein LBM70_04420 [Victivallales bacterium]|jgi:hypothetical protein|nr:hypothetical protein [Victivallales bacterium]
MTLTKKVCCLLLLGLGTVLSAESFPLNRVMRFNEAGRIEVYNRLGGIDGQFEANRFAALDDRVLIDFMDTSYDPQSVIKQDKSTPQLRTYTAKLHKPAMTVDCGVQVSDVTADGVKFTAKVGAENLDKASELFFSLRINRPMLGRNIRFQIKKDNTRYFHLLEMPISQDGGWVWSNPAKQTVEQIDIPMYFGTLRLSGFSSPVMVCKYGDATCNVRIYLPTGVKAVNASINAKFIPYSSTPLNLRSAANMGFADPTPDDNQGGWTDQGPENDFAVMPIGKQLFANVNFDVINPDSNHGKSVLAFRNAARPGFLKEAVIPGYEKRGSWLYLLHAAAWCNLKDVGTVEVAYVDGTKQKFEVKDRRDVGNWWEPRGASNAAVVFRKQNASAMIGLYMSRFPLERKNIKTVRLVSSEESVWLVVAVSVVDEVNLPFPSIDDVQEREYTLNKDAYREFVFDKGVIPGSGLDFSWLLDAPAGKYGRPMINGEHFTFADRPDKPVRFLGANLCEEMNMLDHADSDRLADWIASCGYNAVRFHHFDFYLVKPDSTNAAIDPVQLDRMHYLFAALKKRGIYITLDLYTARKTGFAGKYKSMFEVKTKMMFDPAMRKNLLDFAGNLLLPINPYTNLPMHSDPALISFGLINENPMQTHHEEYKYPNRDAVQNANMKKTYQAWCKKNNLPIAERPSSSEWLRFLLDHQIAVYDEIKSGLAKMGINVANSDFSCSAPFAGAIPRNSYDYVDNHTYFDHPTFPGEMFKFPYSNHNRSDIAMGFPVPLMSASTRIFGKPFMITEYNFCVPNDKRSEGGPIFGALAAMQDWSGIFLFDFGTYSRSWQVKPLANGGHLGSFSAMNDPIQQLSERITALFYLRGDVSALNTCKTFTVTPDVWKNPGAADFALWNKRQNADVPENFTKLGLKYRIGMTVADTVPTGNYSIEELQKGNTLLDLSKEVVSENGQLTANTVKGTLKIVTSRSESLVIPQGLDLTGKSLSVKDNTVFATVFAGGLDSNELIDSKRILILHLTDIKASGQKLTRLGDSIQMYNYGKFSPYLLLKGSAKIELTNKAQGKAKLRALDVNGKILGDVEFTESNGKISFTADTGKYGAMAYELIRE